MGGGPEEGTEGETPAPCNRRPPPMPTPGYRGGRQPAAPLAALPESGHLHPAPGDSRLLQPCRGVGPGGARQAPTRLTAACPPARSLLIHRLLTTVPGLVHPKQRPSMSSEVWVMAFSHLAHTDRATAIPHLEGFSTNKAGAT